MRNAVNYTFAIVWMIVLFVPAFPLLWIWPTRVWRRNVSRIYSKLWGKGCLFVAGIRLEIQGAEHLRTCPAVFTFNHTSLVDFFVNAVFAPRGILVFGKRELARVPFLGWMWFFGAHPMIERKNRDQWEVVLDDVTRLLAQGDHSAIIAPEGTRSRDGQLLPFKKGPFVVALRSGAPVVPVVLKGMMAVFDGKRFAPGRVVAKVLPPIETSDWTLEDLAARIEDVRAAYVRELEA
jgi:1-acyl-sn-glycerol-3-phosphate acyltransferase